MSPKALLKVAGTKAFRDCFTDFVRRLEGRARRDPTLSASRRLCILGSVIMV